MFIPIVTLVIALIVLIKSADYFTDGAEKLAMMLGVSPFIIGATVASVGTSIPELFTSIFAVLKGTPAGITIVVGDVIGSNIANLALVLGVAAIVAKSMKISWNIVNVDLPFLAGSTMYIWLTIGDGLFTLGEAVLGLVFYGVYLIYTLHTHKKEKSRKSKEGALRTLVELVLGGIGVIIGAHFCVEGIIGVGEVFLIPTAVIAATAVAIGTSLPELAVSVKAAMKKKYELAIGNVTGSCIFNALVVMGIPGLISPLIAGELMMGIGLPFLLAVTVLFIVSSIDKYIDKYEAYAMIVLYLLFIAKLFGLF